MTTPTLYQSLSDLLAAHPIWKVGGRVTVDLHGTPVEATIIKVLPRRAGDVGEVTRLVLSLDGEEHESVDGEIL